MGSSSDSAERSVDGSAESAARQRVAEFLSEPPPPPWVLETQRLGWAGTWVATEQNTFSGWVRGLAGTEEPLPFVAASERDGGALRGPDEAGCDPEVLQRLLYPETGELSNYVPWVDETTDQEGWIFASRAEKLNVRRPGGRAGQRYGDRYRRRWWMAAEEQLPATNVVSSPSRARVEEERQRALHSLSQAFKSVFAGRGFHEVPLDPTSYLRRTQRDSAWYESLCAKLPPWTDVGALAEIAVAALYMRAAYGYVARTGMFDSLAAGAMVFSVQKAAFDISEDVDDASHTASFLDMLGLSSNDLVYTRWKADGPFRPAYVIARDRDMKWIVVAVRGTLSMKDVLTDMAAHNVAFLEGQAHEGFVHATQQLLAEAKEQLKSELAAHPGYRLVFCGHSMGGAVATLATALLRSNTDWARDCVAFGIGTPSVVSRCIGERLARERAVFTVIHCRDWSPRTSTSNVNEMLDHLCELSVLRTAMRVATNREIPQSRVEDPITEQLPAGVLLQIAKPGDGGRGHHAMSGPVLLAAEAVHYRHSMPVWPDVEAHIPLFYVRGLLQGLSSIMSSAPPQASLKAYRKPSWRFSGFKSSKASRPPRVDGTLEDFLAIGPGDQESRGHLDLAILDPVFKALRRAAVPAPPEVEAEEAARLELPGSPEAVDLAAASQQNATPHAWDGHLPVEPDSGRVLAARCLVDLHLM